MKKETFTLGDLITLEFGHLPSRNEGVYVGQCEGLHITIFDKRFCDEFFWDYCESHAQMLEYVSKRGDNDLKKTIENLTDYNPDAKFFISTKVRISLLVKEITLEEILINLKSEIR